MSGTCYQPVTGPDEPRAYDTGPGAPVSGCGREVTAMTGAEHYAAAERALAAQALNADSPGALKALRDEAHLHYLAAIAAAMCEQPRSRLEPVSEDEDRW